MRARVLVVAMLVVAAAACAAGAAAAADARRRLAHTLVSREAARRDRSLRDVLDAPRPSTPPRPPPADPAEPVVVRAWSELFAWGINYTVRHAELSVFANLSAAATVVAPSRRGVPAVFEPRPEPRPAEPYHFAPSVYSPPLAPLQSRAHVHDALPSQPTTASTPQLAEKPYVTLSNFGLDEDETEVMMRALSVLEAAPVDDVSARVEALLILEELCHGMETAQDLHAAGGLHVVVGGLEAEDAEVRASAAWALSTCSQNNPTVQNASYSLGAVPVLMRMAAEDVPNVCSRALLALNALVELNAARALFETVVSESTNGIEALRRPLVEQPDTRATRRALNLAELLAQRNLDAWKTYIEAWDLGPVIESIMRGHYDPDVRESAARLITVLDGKDPIYE